MQLNHHSNGFPRHPLADLPGSSPHSAPSSGTERKLFPGPIPANYVLDVSGQPFTVVPFSKSECALRFPEDMAASEKQKFLSLADTLLEIRPYIQRISERLNDPADGATLRFAGKLAARLPDFPFNVQLPLRDYLTAVIRNGSTLHYPKMSVIIPPVSYDKLQELIHINARDLDHDPDVGAFFGRAYCSVPLATRGYHLFGDARSEERFHAAVIEANPTIRAKLVRLDELFDKRAGGVPLSNAEAEEYDQISTNYCNMQRIFLEQKLRSAPDAEWINALSTRVTITIDASGNFSFSAAHYQQVFRKDLDAIADIFERAQNDLPASAPDLANMLSGYERWARDLSGDHYWGESINEWLVIDNPNNRVDVGLCAEEIGSFIGKKGDFQFTLFQHAPVPESVKELWQVAQQRTAPKGIRLALLSTVASAGHSFNLVILGENLPNRPRTYQGHPLQRSMTFENVTQLGSFDANRPRIQRSMGLSDAEVDRLRAGYIAVVHVMSHELGHTFDFDPPVSFLTKRTHVAEMDAEASAAYLPALYSPNDAEDMARFTACWLPCRRAVQGLSSAHSQSDLVLFDEYFQAGLVKVVTDNGPAHLEVTDCSKLIKAAFHLALQSRLWQRGVPLETQREWLGDIEFNRNDPDQADRIVSELQQRIDSIAGQDGSLIARWRDQVNAEVETYFSLDKMQRIKNTLTPVLEQMGAPQPLLLIPGDERLDRLVEFPA